MTEQQAMQIARDEYARLILDGMGIFLIAEAWGIERQYPGSVKALSLDLVWIDTPEPLKQRGFLSEPYLLAEMAKQVRAISSEEEESSKQKAADDVWREPRRRQLRVVRKAT